MSRKFPYYSITFLHLLKQSLYIFLIVYITATPAFKIIFHQLDLKYEHCEIYDEEDPKEKEMFVDDAENEDQEFYSSQNHLIFHTHSFFTEFNPDIQLPPPKKS